MKRRKLLYKRKIEILERLGIIWDKRITSLKFRNKRRKANRVAHISRMKNRG